MKLKLSFRNKVITGTVLIVSVSLIACSYITFNYVTQIVRDQAVRDNMTKLAQMSSSIKRMQERLENTAETIIAAEEINKPILLRESDSLQERYFKKVAVQKQLQRFVALDSNLLNMMIIRPDQEVFSNYSGYESYYADYLQGAWLTPFLSGQISPGHFSAPHEFRYINGNQKVISYVTAYKNWEDLSADAAPYILVLDLKLTEVEKIFEDSEKDFARLALSMEDGIVVYDSAGVNRERPNAATQQQQRVIPLKYQADDGKWVLEAFLSESKLMESVRPILYFYLLIVFGSLLFAMAVIPPVSAKFTRPISQLARAMRRVSAGELNTRVSFRTGDEMEELAAGFNQMVNDLDLWMKSSLREQEMKRKMQINLLLSEINPHFIYNTLNTVIYLSHAGRNQDTITMTKAFIDILQDTIKTGEGAYFCTLQEEIDMIRKYVVIQQYRYPGRFRLEWDIPSELHSCQVLRMMLQPLVENALFHGIEDNGLIRISAAVREGGLHICVKDNGIGMEPERLRELSLPRKEMPVKKGIGLANVMERITYHYGEAYGIEVDSEPGRGTVVSLRLPYLREEVSAIDPLF
ncbi:histidine kinase [Paenibacillus sp. DXFW5]|uniref:histidine kinase n=1 Tax=Paenibacillus rhizolycopersici TaxID=2780073 RepID=A0ABS2H8E6_9BACL|nr:histidine kinase [Paenibacillus rhizolycopersici]MBM6996269.1 histidine kinase [Paenibacillus rhizolycopersici]